jgi:uncharacterized protein YdeI (YjbR/CyaY-like superfamily)
MDDPTTGMPAEPFPLLYVPGRTAWRGWLEQHYHSEPDVWLVYYRKETGKPRVAYNDAVEEALCFGWIDSIVRSIDAERFAQRFSPRRPGSAYSQPNRERLRRLADGGSVASDVLPAVEAILREPFVEPADVLEALQADPAGWANFERYSGAYRRIRIAFVDHARSRPEEFQKRLRHLIRMNAANRQFGHDLEAYY